MTSRSPWLRQGLAPSITTRVENGFAPPHALTNYAALAGLPSSCSRWWARLSSTHPLVAAENYAALTRDTNR